MKTKKILSRDELLKLSQEERMKKFLDEVNDFHYQSGRLIAFNEKIMEDIENGVDCISEELLHRLFKVAYAYVNQCKKIFELYRPVVDISHEQYTGLQQDVADVLSKLRKQKSILKLNIIIYKAQHGVTRELDFNEVIERRFGGQKNDIRN